MRKQLDMSQAAFARYAMVDPATISRWESATNPQSMGPVPERLLRLALKNIHGTWFMQSAYLGGQHP